MGKPILPGKEKELVSVSALVIDQTTGGGLCNRAEETAKLIAGLESEAVIFYLHQRLEDWGLCHRGPDGEIKAMAEQVYDFEGVIRSVADLLKPMGKKLGHLVFWTDERMDPGIALQEEYEKQECPVTMALYDDAGLMSGANGGSWKEAFEECRFKWTEGSEADDNWRVLGMMELEEEVKARLAQAEAGVIEEGLAAQRTDAPARRM